MTSPDPESLNAMMVTFLASGLTQCLLFTSLLDCGGLLKHPGWTETPSQGQLCKTGH